MEIRAPSSARPFGLFCRENLTLQLPSRTESWSNRRHRAVSCGHHGHAIFTSLLRRVVLGHESVGHRDLVAQMFNAFVPGDHVRIVFKSSANRELQGGARRLLLRTSFLAISQGLPTRWLEPSWGFRPRRCCFFPNLHSHYALGAQAQYGERCEGRPLEMLGFGCEFRSVAEPF